MNTKALSNSSGKHQKGIGLIEILVAVILISIGFLAAARMQVAGMHYSQSAYNQSQAYLLASEMIDRMRGNAAGVNAGFYDDAQTSATAENPNCKTQACTPRGMAAQDIADWSEMLHGPAGVGNFNPVLPSSSSIQARGVVSRLAEGRYRITMTWSEVIDGVDATQTLPIQFSIEE